MKFKATKSNGRWWVGVVWEGGTSAHYGGESILPRPLPDQATAQAVADHMNQIQTQRKETP